MQPIPEEVLNDIIDSAAPRWREVSPVGKENKIVDSTLMGTFFNGNVNWVIDSIVVEISLGDKNVFYELVYF